MNRRIVSIQLLRALACLQVLLVHIGVHNPITAYQLSGSIGVDIFFVISGFIISSSVNRLPPKGAAYAFLVSRFTRVVPYYYVVTLAYACFIFLLYRQLPSVGDLVRSFLFWPTAHGPVLPIGWTLNHEMFFYLFVGVGLLLTRDMKRIAAALAVLLALLQLVPAPHEGLLQMAKASINVEFLFGILIYQLRSQLLPHFRSLLWLSVSVVLLLVVMRVGIELPVLEKMKPADPAGAYFRDTIFLYRWPLGLPRGLFWGVPAALVFVAVLAQEPRLQHFSAQNLVLRIGNASFTLYIIQGFFLSATDYFKVSHLLTLSIIVAVVIAAALWLTGLESWIARRAKSLLPTSADAPAAV